MKKGLFLLLMFTVFYGCRKEPIAWDVDGLIPLMHSKITLQQAIPEDMLSVVNGNELQLEYQGNLIQLKLDSSLHIPDTSIADTFILPFGNIVFPPGEVFLEDSNFTRYDFGNAKLTQLNIQTGEMTLVISSFLEGPSVLEYSLPTATKNGVSLFIKENIPASSNGIPSIINKSIDLSGYEISLTGLLDTDYNVIASKYRAYIDSSSSPVTISAGQRFVATNTLSNISPSYLRGFFGSEKSNLSETNEPLDLFSNIKGGQFTLENATMVFEIENSAGVDATVQVNQIIATNSFNNSSVELISPLSGSPININRATETNGIYSSPYPSSYSIELNTLNSNITSFIGTLPNELSYDFTIDLNPLGNVSLGNDFLYGNTGMEINLDAKIPLNFNAQNLVFIDTSDFTINTDLQNETSKIIGGFINIYNTNWFPFDIELQLYMLDEDLQVIDSIFASKETIFGGIPIFGVVDDPIQSIIQAPLTSSKIDNLYRAKSIQSLIQVNSTDTGNIRILDSYFIETRLVGDFKYRIEIE